MQFYNSRAGEKYALSTNPAVGEVRRPFWCHSCLHLVLFSSRTVHLSTATATGIVWKWSVSPSQTQWKYITWIMGTKVYSHGPPCVDPSMPYMVL